MTAPTITAEMVAYVATRLARYDHRPVGPGHRVRAKRVLTGSAVTRRKVAHDMAHGVAP